MLLLDLKSYLESHTPVSMMDLTAHYRVEPDALRGMLDHWIRKGKLKRLDFGSTCQACPHGGACGACCASCFEMYQWLDGTGNGKAASPDRRS
ncbi:FeoC-like transcriptional regulator [Methyloligella sp. 2.7D]|uniref:FeoC-like transcriptional regulator n=1 Tax=unclassified Methyloligella TaxID=2625955 RepID=UPI00157BF723|nr:FeoC-like transcriptional regulator [Methyloligella sp. GL2]QKP78115.1 FeoC-like transcriptional regulator [Methyloligella sp. GL2]